MTPISSIPELVSDLRNNKMVVLVDDEDRENEGDLIIPAELVTAEHINFMAKHGRGLICLSLLPNDIDRLQLPMMSQNNKSPYSTAFTISIEAASGVSTGISAFDRAKTIQVAINPNSTPDDIVTPGHMFPLKANPNGVLSRAGHTEASVDLARIAGYKPAGVICEIMNDDGSMARLDELKCFAHTHKLKIGTIADLISYRQQYETNTADYLMS